MKHATIITLKMDDVTSEFYLELYEKFLLVQDGNPVLSRLFEAKLDQFIRDSFIKKFWNSFYDSQKSEYCASSTALMKATKFLESFCEKIINTLKETKHQNLKNKLFNHIKVHILSSKPHYLHESLVATYLRAFICYMTFEVHNANNQQSIDQSLDNTDEEEQYLSSLLDKSSSISLAPVLYDCDCDKSCKCETICVRFSNMNNCLRNLDLLDGLVGDTVMNVAKSVIEKRVAFKGKSNYSRSYLNELTIWVNEVVKKWVSNIYGFSDKKDVDELGGKLKNFLKVAYADVRVANMFEIIIEYPNSEAAVQDLKMCLNDSPSPTFRLHLINSVKQSLIESLLHPGVNTYDILTAYISAIKALRALDPSGLILQLITDPVRRYLKSRDDTVRCIVTALTDEENNSELNREMIRSSTQTNENGIFEKNGNIEMNLPNEGEKCTATNFEKWKPDPIKLSSSDEIMKSNRYSDIVSILVNIYETKDLFVEEYQKLLSQRLLNKYEECSLDTELRNLELLTLRFSDCELHRCEVMLKDVQTSKRINKRILSGDIREHKLENFKNLDVLIVSSPFWPEKFSPMESLSDESPKITFPAEIQSAITTYTKAFEAIQASRTLHWRHHLGTVNLDLTMGGKTQNFNVSPLHASILYLFKLKKVWQLSELVHKTSVPAATIRSRLALWMRNGLIEERENEIYSLVE